MTLFNMKPGQSANIIKFTGGEAHKKYLLSLGCFEGVKITLISILGGSYIINIKTARYAVDASLAKHLEVEFRG